MIKAAEGIMSHASSHSHSNKEKPLKIPLFSILITSLATPAFADTTPNYDNPKAIMADLRKAAKDCSGMADGQVKDEVFGIQIVRIGDTCVVINGDEIDHHALQVLEEQKLDWVGVGLWIKANPGTD